MFKRALIALAAVAAFGAQAAGGLGVSVGTGGAGSSITVVQGGVTNTVSLGNTTIAGNYASSSSFSTVSFDATTWTVSGGAFTAAIYNPGGTYVSNTNISTYVTAAQTALSTAVTDEVTHIGTLVTDVSNKVTAYNSASNFDTDTTSTAAQVVVTSMNTLTTEVSTTKSTIDYIKALKFTTATGLTSTNVTLGGQVYADYSGQVRNIIQTTGGNNTIGANGNVTFGP